MYKVTYYLLGRKSGVTDFVRLGEDITCYTTLGIEDIAIKLKERYEGQHEVTPVITNIIRIDGHIPL